MSRHGCGRLKIDTYLLIPQRFVLCFKCGSTYNGPKEKVVCEGCKSALTTNDVKCDKRIPTGQWVISNQRAKTNDHPKKGNP